MTLDDLPAGYSTILCDVWGVLHDGGALYPGAKARLTRWRDEGRKVVLITNAPRPAKRVEADLETLGLDASLWHAVTSSGQAGIAAVTDPLRSVGFAGTADDYADLEDAGVRFAAAQEPHDEIVLTGLDETRSRVDEYAADLEAWAKRGMTIHCLNPDHVVIHQGHELVCAGALADAYEQLGGKVVYYGKPHAPIFDHALKLAGNPPRNRVVMVGDGPDTDMAGARGAGIEAVFVTGGIQQGAPVDWPGDWAPLISVAAI